MGPDESAQERAAEPRVRERAAAGLPLALLCVLLFAGCQEEPLPPEPSALPPDTSAAPDTVPALRYTRYPLTGATALETLIEKVGEADYGTILKLNRIDAGYARQGDTLIIPEPVPSLRDLSPFPVELPRMHSIPKVLLVSLGMQAWGAYEFGLLARWGPTSTGKRSTPTCPGFYYTNWKSPQRASTIDSTWILKWYFNIDNFGGCSIHVYDLPGRPASHSCVRTLEEDAQWIYEWADQWILTRDENLVLRNGSPLVVFGDYDFDAPPPWKSLPEDPDIMNIPLRDIEEAIDTLATPHQLASLSPEGLKIEVQVGGAGGDFRMEHLEKELATLDELRLLRYDFMVDKVVLLAPAGTRFDFDSLRVALIESGLVPGRVLVEGIGKAQRVEGMAAMVADDGTVLFLLESMAVPGMGYLHPVEFRFRGLVSARAAGDDSASAFRLVLSRVERLRPEGSTDEAN
jgi:hypothetical protein